MRKTLWIAMICGLIAALLLGVCAVSAQKEVFEKQSAYCKDDMGYQTEPYAFYFNEGENELTIRAVNEPVILCAVSLTPIMKSSTYAEYAAAQPEVSASEEALNYSQTIQGESAVLRSTPSLYGRYDRSSALTEPYSVSNSILNYIGGEPWTHPGEWIQWEFEVPEDGYYNISIKARQMYQRGALSARTVYIDGEIPFEDLEAVTFSYSTGWDMHTLSDKEGTPFRFWLKKGSHSIRMEVTMGEMGPVLKSVEDSIFRLNQIYRKILVLTGANPDKYRDYNLKRIYPEAIEAMDLESKRLYKIVDDTVAITGEKSDRIASAQTLAVQLETFVKKNERITESFQNFRDNITSLGTAMQNMAESKLDVDLIMVTGENVKVPGIQYEFNQELEKALRLEDFFEIGELMARDALNRNESCGGHFRVESQTEEGEAKRDDANYMYVAAWEYKGDGVDPELHKEPLVYENIKVITRNYKD